MPTTHALNTKADQLAEAFLNQVRHLLKPGTITEQAVRFSATALIQTAFNIANTHAHQQTLIQHFTNATTKPE